MRGSFFALITFLITYFGIELGFIWSIIITILVWAFMSAWSSITSAIVDKAIEDREWELEEREMKRKEFNANKNI